MKKLLISEQKLKSFTSATKSIDVDLLKSEIGVVQDIDLQAILGTKFLNSLLDKISLTGNTLTTAEKTLVDDYISSFLCHRSWENTLPTVWAKAMNAGVINGNPEFGNSVDLKTIQYLKGLQADKAEFYRKRLISYLTCEDGKNAFPDYENQTYEDGLTPDKDNTYQSSIVLTGNKPKYKNIEHYSEYEMLYGKKIK